MVVRSDGMILTVNTVQKEVMKLLTTRAIQRALVHITENTRTANHRRHRHHHHRVPAV